MRRKDRELTDINDIIRVIDGCKVCRIAIKDTQGLYILPLNFGYEMVDGQMIMFFHSAKEGRKINAIKENGQVAFEMDCKGRLKDAETACGYGYYFSSVIGTGRAEIIEDMEEKKRGLAVLMKHQTGKDFVFDENMADKVCVFKVKADSLCAKSHQG